MNGLNVQFRGFRDVYLLLLVLCFVAVSLYLFPINAIAQDNSSSIIIGALLDLSGPYSKEGKAAYSAIRLAVEQLNTQDGIKGQRIEIAVFDTKGRSSSLLSGAHQLQSRYDALLLVGPSSPFNVLLLRKYAETNRIPIILISGFEPILKFKNIKTLWTFSSTINFDSELKALFLYFSKKGYKTLGGLIENSKANQKLNLWLRGYTPEYGMTISCLNSFNPNQEDLILKFRYLSECEPDIAMLWAGWDAAPLIHRNLAATAVPLALNHQLFIKNPSDLHLSDGKLLYVVVPPIFFYSSLSKSSLSYFVIKRFINAWGPDFENLSLKEQLAAAQAWDAIQLASRGIFAASAITRAALRDAMEEKIDSYIGITGTFSPDKQNHSGLLPESLLILRSLGTRWQPILLR